jgi:hypothetical protein
MTRTFENNTVVISDRWVEFIFPDFSLTYGTTKQFTSNPLSITNWTVTITVTFGMSDSGELVGGSLDNESFNCSQWNPSIKNWVVGCYGPGTTSNKMSWCSTNNYKVWAYEIASCDLSARARSPSWWCPSEYRLPSTTDWNNVITAWWRWTDYVTMWNELGMQVCNVYWTSTSFWSWVKVNNEQAYDTFIPCNWRWLWNLIWGVSNQSAQNLVRCFKN